MVKRISVSLTEEEDQLIKWLAKNDGVSYSRELQQVFYVELEQLMMLYGEEMKGDQE